MVESGGFTGLLVLKSVCGVSAILLNAAVLGSFSEKIVQGTNDIGEGDSTVTIVVCDRHGEWAGAVVKQETDFDYSVS